MVLPGRKVPALLTCERRLGRPIRRQTTIRARGTLLTAFQVSIDTTWYAAVDRLAVRLDLERERASLRRVGDARAHAWRGPHRREQQLRARLDPAEAGQTD